MTGPADRLELVVITGRSVGTTVALDDEPCHVGRAADCRLRIDDDGISRLHCRIVREEAGWWLNDNRSSGGTFLNGRRIDRRLLAAGDKITIGGGTILKVVRSGERAADAEAPPGGNDPFTGADDKARTVWTVKREVQRAIAENTPLSIAMINIDRLKQINDVSGSKMGDDVIVRVAHIAQQLARTSDRVGRVAGDEFTLLMPDTALEPALAICERLRAAVERTVMVADDQTQLAFTVSIGAAELVREPAETPKALVQRAAHGLSRAKGSGRNVVHTVAPGEH